MAGFIYLFHFDQRGRIHDGNIVNGFSRPLPVIVLWIPFVKDRVDRSASSDTLLRPPQAPATGPRPVCVGSGSRYWLRELSARPSWLRTIGQIFDLDWEIQIADQLLDHHGLLIIFLTKKSHVSRYDVEELTDHCHHPAEMVRPVSTFPGLCRCRRWVDPEWKNQLDKFPFLRGQRPARHPVEPTERDRFPTPEGTASQSSPGSN